MFKNRCIDISKYVFLLLFLLFFGSVTFFNHAHVVDGITVIHSHPFRSDNSGNPMHDHTTSGYQLIHLLVTLINTAVVFLIVFYFLPVFIGKIADKYFDRVVIKTFFIQHPLRGPPAFIHA
jgi:hypothetical protein